MPMPQVGQPSSKYARVLIYGPEKTKKTWWAVKAAELGFNVILLDSDDGRHIVNEQTIDVKAFPRISMIPIVDRVDDMIACQFTMLMLNSGRTPFFYDEDAYKLIPIDRPAANVWRVDMTRLTSNDVVVIDSWTALAWSAKMKAAEEQDIKLEEMKKTQGRDVYLPSGNYMDVIRMRLHALPCHVIVIGHANTYEKWDNNKKPPVLISQRVQPISTSGPNAEKLGKEFSDMLVTKLVGSAVHIDTQNHQGIACGSRVIPPALYPWDKLQFKDVCNFHRIPLPGPDAPLCSAFKFYPAGEAAEPLFSKPAATTVSGTAAKTRAETSAPLDQSSKPAVGLTALFAKKG